MSDEEFRGNAMALLRPYQEAHRGQVLINSKEGQSGAGHPKIVSNFPWSDSFLAQRQYGFNAHSNFKNNAVSN